MKLHPEIQITSTKLKVSATIFALPIRLMLSNQWQVWQMRCYLSPDANRNPYSHLTLMVPVEFICLQVYLSQTESQSRPREKLSHFSFKSKDLQLHSRPPLDLPTLIRSISACLPTQSFGQCKYAYFHFSLVQIPSLSSSSHSSLAFSFSASFTALWLWREPTQSILLCSCCRVFVVCIKTNI